MDGQTVKVKGPKGELSVKLVQEVTAAVDEHGIHVTPRKEMEKAPQMWGLSRTLVNNLVTGVTQGFTQKLEIQGVGYRAAVQGKVLNLQLGFSHDVPYAIPAGISITSEKPTMISVSGIDKQLVGQVAAEIRGYAEVETKGHKELEIELKYHDGEPVIRELKRVSTPGRRVYSSVSDLKPHRQGLGVSILSTPQGVMTDTSAREKNVGGEVLCQVF